MSELIILDFDKNIYKLGSVCKRGHTYKDLKNWNLRSINKNDCVQCKRESGRVWHKDNADKERKRKRVHYLENIDIYKQSANNWFLNNLEKHKENGRKWFRKNRENTAKRLRRFRLNNPDKCAIYTSRYAKSTKGKVTSLRRNYRRRARNKNVLIESNIDLKVIYDHFNNECCYCGSNSKLTLEHLKPLASGGSHTTYNLACACSTCNSSKGASNLIVWYPQQSFYDHVKFVRIIQWMNG